MISPKNDIYSLGLTLWEMVLREKPFAEYIRKFHRGEDFDREKFNADIQAKRLTRIRGTQCWPEFEELILSCVNFDRRLRPEAGEALLTVRALQVTDFLQPLPDRPI
ncbi:unnamed protein product, partial [Mesorhabditis belari]|uniref:Protein kinase domain-containing protein n=1 Tax=Mesorhabditis belari TaxID=2138241 RepID=A0AAF3EEJ1_9BILA